jgi:SAM-dependent methyltransferase
MTLTLTEQTIRSIPTGYGYPEFLRHDGQQLTFAGWLLALDGGFDQFEILLPTGEKYPAQLIVRPELAELHPHIPNAARGGFLAMGQPPPLGPQDTFEFMVVGVRGGRSVCGMVVGYHHPPRPVLHPPAVVMSRAAGAAVPTLWEATGIKNVNDFRRVLAKHVDLHRITRLLEWGCGSGRLTQHLIARFPWARVHGTDIDAEAAAWAGAHFDGEFVACDKSPPLRYADAAFDLVVSLTVFTHRTESFQAAWLQELRRIIAPGGLLLATTHGEFAGRWLFPKAKEFAKVFATGFHDAIPDGTLQHVASSEYYRSTFQSKAWTERNWSKYFDVVDYVEGGMNNFQDIWVLRRPRR